MKPRTACPYSYSGDVKAGLSDQRQLLCFLRQTGALAYIDLTYLPVFLPHAEVLFHLCRGSRDFREKSGVCWHWHVPESAIAWLSLMLEAQQPGHSAMWPQRGIIDRG